jgi:hypothetical protein
MVPGKPVGGRNALGIGERTPSDVGTLSAVQLARVRVARRLAPVDLFEPAPSPHEWALGAVLHDLVQAAHPGFDAVFRRSGPARMLTVIDRTLELVPSPETAGDALSRHTWFSRMLDLARTDVEVRWWTGHQTFLGEDPPARLLAWPEFRRVQQLKTPRPLMDLPTSGSAVDAHRFATAVSTLLSKSPLTDLATMTRATPAFSWTRENLTFIGTSAGRTMALRALAYLPERLADAVLGRATRGLFQARALRATGVALDLLRDRALMTAEARLSGGETPEPLTLGPENNDAAFAVSAGALAATEWIARTGGGFGEAERKALLVILQPASTGAGANEIRALLATA